MILPEHIRALLNPATYPHPATDIRLLETHISWVILTGAYAYKIKKPLDLGFLDFSTLAKRKHFCLRELELNRRFAAGLYLEVLPVGRGQTGFRIGVATNVVDYCLKMRQFNHLLIEQVQKNTFDARWMDVLAQDIARFHAGARIIRQSRAGDALWQHMQANLETAAQHIPAALNRQQYERLHAFCRDEFQRCQPLLEQRQQQGFVRDCHGDLHLRNIALIQGHPVPFDCIEFNNALREIDVLNDTAFLLMDCDANQRPELGFRFLSRYLEHCGDYAGLNVLPLFLYYRACVRGKVACILADEQRDKQRAWQQAGLFFSLAETYMHMPSPKLFVIGGLSGSGKSHLALLGCGRERAIVIRSDATRMRLAAEAPDLERYGREMHLRTYDAMFQAARDALHAGFPVILDATFLHIDSRRQIQQLAQTCGVPLHAYWLDIPEHMLRDNIRRRQQCGQDVSEADLSVLEQQLREYQRPDEPWWQFVDSAARWPAAHG